MFEGNGAMLSERYGQGLPPSWSAAERHAEKELREGQINLRVHALFLPSPPFLFFFPCWVKSCRHAGDDVAARATGEIGLGSPPSFFFFFGIHFEHQEEFAGPNLESGARISFPLPSSFSSPHQKYRRSADK